MQKSASVVLVGDFTPTGVRFELLHLRGFGQVNNSLLSRTVKLLKKTLPCFSEDLLAQPIMYHNGKNFFKLWYKIGCTNITSEKQDERIFTPA